MRARHATRWAICWASLVGSATAACGAPPDVIAEGSSTFCEARPEGDLPVRLSELGCFDGDPRVLATDVIPYSINAPLWLDDAEKERFMAIPDGSTIALDEHGDFILPPGTVLGKTFIVGGARVETRILMNDPASGWHGQAYRWNAEGTDAELAPEQGEELQGVGEHAQDWTIPGRASCMGCHNEETHVSLGLEVAQLNRDSIDPFTREATNQLDALVALGLLDSSAPPLAESAARPALADYRDESQPVDARARSYLAGNCASCHTSPANYCTGDFRWTASAPEMGVCDEPPKMDNAYFGWPDDTRLIKPGDPDRSALIQRVQAPGGTFEAMPPAGRHLVDTQGVALLRQWITEMNGCDG